MAAVQAELESSPNAIDDVEGFMGKRKGGEDHCQGNALLRLVENKAPATATRQKR
jgi:hypothetical protein